MEEACRSLIIFHLRSQEMYGMFAIHCFTLYTNPTTVCSQVAGTAIKHCITDNSQAVVCFKFYYDRMPLERMAENQLSILLQIYDISFYFI